MKSYKIGLGFFKGLFKSMKFNVTLIEPHNYKHSLALAEAAEYIHIRINQSGYESALTINHLERDSINVVLCGHLAPEELLKIDQKLIIFNSEQLPEDSVWTSPQYKSLLDKNFVWDYSPINLLKIKDIYQIFEVNFFSNICLFSFLLKRKIKKLLIVNINSLAGISGSANESIYAASKHALRGFYESISNEKEMKNFSFLNIFSGAFQSKISKK